MKRICLILIAMTSMAACMFTLNARPLFIYSASEGVISLDTDNILSIDYEDADAEMQGVQKFNTPDSTYVFRIADIDSVSFQTPKSQFHPGVDFTKSLSGYVISSHELVLKLKKETPAKIMPVKGQIIYIEADDDIMTIPFAGRVVSVTYNDDGITIECDPVELTDIFESFYGVIGIPENVDSRRLESKGTPQSGGFLSYDPGCFNYDTGAALNYEFNEDSPFSISGAGHWTTTIDPLLKYSGYCIVNKKYGVNIGITLITDLSIKDCIQLAGQMDVSKDIKLVGCVIPLRQILLDIYFECGITATASASVAVDRTHEKCYRHTYHFDWSSRRRKKASQRSSFSKTKEIHNGVFAINGSTTVGVYAEIGIAFVCTANLDIAKADVRMEGGLRTEGNWVPSKKESANAMKSSDYYNRIADAHLQSGAYSSAAAELHLCGWASSYDDGLLENFNTFYPFEEISLVPGFTNLKATKTGQNKVEASVTANGNTFPCDVGMAIVKDGNVSGKSYFSSNYTGPTASVNASFTKLSPDGKYQVRPLVRTMGVEMLAEPYQDIDAIPIYGHYTCVWYTTPPNAKLLEMDLNQDYTMSQTYYYANRGETITYRCTYSTDGETLTFHKDNGDTQLWHIDELTERTLVISQPDGFTYHFVR